VRNIAGQLIAHGSVTNSGRAYLGIQGSSTTTSGGVLVTKVQPGGPGVKAGITVGDVITAANGTATPDIGALADVLAEMKPGQLVSLAVTHPDGSRQTVRSTLAQYPD
jgi:putative serine protease PepD